MLATGTSSLPEVKSWISVSCPALPKQPDRLCNYLTSVCGPEFQLLLTCPRHLANSEKVLKSSPEVRVELVVQENIEEIRNDVNVFDSVVQEIAFYIELTLEFGWKNGELKKEIKHSKKFW